MKKKQLFVGIFTALMFTMLIGVKVSAEERPENSITEPIIISDEQLTEFESITFDVIEEQLDNQIVSPNLRLSWTGSAGTSRLVYMGGGNFNWSLIVHEAAGQPMIFLGIIDIYTESTKKYKGTIYLAGEGTGSISGVNSVDFKLKKGSRYTAKFSGVAATTKKRYSVVPEAYSEWLGFEY